MFMDPLMPQAVAAILIILLTGIVIKIMRQPQLITYLLVGMLIGPWGLELVTDPALITRLGAIGVVLLLFFVGMETDASKLVANWKLAVFGTFLQILLSIACVWLIGLWYEWSLARIVLIGFVISLSSTVVVIKLLQDNGLLNSKMGQGVLGITLVQDLAIIPMLIILGLFTAGDINPTQLFKQGVGTILAAALFGYIIYRKEIHLPFARWLHDDKELQLFTGLSLCFGLSLITAWFDLSTALGAFMAGMFIGVSKETQWVHHNLESFKVLFVALFFVSVGMLLDLSFLLQHWVQVSILVLAALLTNTFINALILRMAKFSWHDSLFAGLLLSQISEFSFVLAAVGYQAHIITNVGYQLSICAIALSLLLSPLWINSGRRLLHWQQGRN
ncbi:cation:proton antiporter [Dasania sp. GY-MA-18]|uniref:Cation:proton antiporter n=1 Tax=Dasania phycosphaerae TaxID=2950436 RepID=A0A9J6RQM5_9GAMM|nr:MULTISPECIES: cation:proton antiporter [Dasania]MCR8923915.1 cation:proton antiporter [Dasania sp. GY-MA-18]MCZ0866349.1 cation:proton antiporter [Dasania phycosphaerae]MCZ0870073.1 cation:proton antiporter [Dasania phycosphaerae]